MKKEYNIDCTGDCCMEDEVMFDRAVFVGGGVDRRGRFKSGTFSHNETIFGKIIKDSYGISI